MYLAFHHQIDALGQDFCRSDTDLGHSKSSGGSVSQKDIWKGRKASQSSAWVSLILSLVLLIPHSVFFMLVVIGSRAEMDAENYARRLHHQGLESNESFKYKYKPLLAMLREDRENRAVFWFTESLRSIHTQQGLCRQSEQNVFIWNIL